MRVYMIAGKLSVRHINWRPCLSERQGRAEAVTHTSSLSELDHRRSPFVCVDFTLRLRARLVSHFGFRGVVVMAMRGHGHALFPVIDNSTNEFSTRVI